MICFLKSNANKIVNIFIGDSLIINRQNKDHLISPIRSITSNYPPPSDNFFQKTRGGVVGEFFPSSKIFAWGEVEITPTKSVPAAGI